MILADTNVVVSTLVATEPTHARVASWLAINREPIGMLSLVLAEVSHFLHRAGAWDAEEGLVERISSGRALVLDPVTADCARALEIMRQYRDLHLGIVDTVLMAMAERLDVRTILTLDHRHFGAVRPRHCESFTLVP